MKAFTTYLLGMSQANCFITHKKLTMYPLGKLPFAPSEWASKRDTLKKDVGTRESNIPCTMDFIGHKVRVKLAYQGCV